GMGMRIDEARRNQPAARIERGARAARQLARHARLRAYPRHTRAAERDRAALDDAEWTLAQRRRHGEDQAGVLHEHIDRVSLDCSLVEQRSRTGAQHAPITKLDDKVAIG